MVLADGTVFRANKVILTTGTFLSGVIHIGNNRVNAGRMGDAAAIGTSHKIEQVI